MRIAVAGGKLQGAEACYLARKAGWNVRLVDCRSDAIARGLCDEFVLSDLAREENLSQVFGDVELILPALEVQEVLDVLSRFSATSGIPLAFDPRAYRISSSKLLSDRLFAELGLPAPKPWPEAKFPLVAKPSAGSGSRGVRIIQDSERMHAVFLSAKPPAGWVVQEYLGGPSYSLEVISVGGHARCFQVAELFMDAGYDCKRVMAPAELPASLTGEFERIGRTIAEAIDLRGLMDVEVILNGGQLKVLEIDARLPSQTPTVVFWSSGVNLVQVLGEAVCDNALPPLPALTSGSAVVYEHIQVRPSLLEIGGEHLMASARTLQVYPGFFGADEAITDYSVGRDDWRATLIITGSDRGEAWQKRCKVLADIRRSFGIGQCLNTDPMVSL